MTFCIRKLLITFLIFLGLSVHAQQQYELNSGWKCRKAYKLAPALRGEDISKISYSLAGWMPATVPGTVLTTLLNNKLIPDPFYGMNNKHIPDIYDSGAAYYTYWFVKDFSEPCPTSGDNIWLTFRGINYSCDIFINGHKVNDNPAKGMFLRHNYNITPFMSKDGHNRLAVIVFPPDPPGNPNGGQGGDGMIAHNVTNQYVAGWDWIQPIHDRNTGIWDKVFIKKAKQISISNTHVITEVPGTRYPTGKQAPAIVKVTTEITNADIIHTVSCVIQVQLGGITVNKEVSITPGSTELINLPALTLNDPVLWWPNGYGPQNLYTLQVRALLNGRQVSDEDDVTFGVRALEAVWNNKTNSREIHVNGQKIFIKGGNRILSDEMLRFSPERYDAEVRYHRDMNLNLIRVWGGGITERLEFYDACDKYGILVMQDFWVSGDCNGRWYDPMKLEDTTARRNYPDDHSLFVKSLADQIRMLRNHPSLAIWCGGNEIRPSDDILKPLRDSLLPTLDGTRFFFEYSNDDSMSLHSGDGPYTIQPDTFFWQHRSFPFNSEVGSVGIGDYESLQRFIPKENLIPPHYDVASRKWTVDSVWQYHKYIGYDSAIEAYGHPKDIKDFAMKAQLVNYNQYRALMEGATAHMWDWYTGIIIWKTQNPWTAMLGQMYDVYLDPNACLYGLREGAKPLHIMYDPVNECALVANNKPDAARVTVYASFTTRNNETNITRSETLWIPPYSCVPVHPFNGSARLPSEYMHKSVFHALNLFDSASKTFDQNIYALPDSTGSLTWLSVLSAATLSISARYGDDRNVIVTLDNKSGNTIAFFNRISLIDKQTKRRILPAFYNNNYISVLPGELKSVTISFAPLNGIVPMVCIEGLNLQKQFIDITK